MEFEDQARGPKETLRAWQDLPSPGNAPILKGIQDLKVCFNIRKDDQKCLLSFRCNPSNLLTPKFPAVYHCRERGKYLEGLSSIQQSAKGNRVPRSPRAAQSQGEISLRCQRA